jgi:uncharacterized GH25 family protein
MRRNFLITALCLVFVGFHLQAAAHTLWVNLYESFAHPPGHAIISLAWGHGVPMDDLLASDAGSLQLAIFDLIDPNFNRTALPLPKLEIEEANESGSGFKIQGGDMGLWKLSRTENIKPGTYQVVAASKDNYFTKYVDKNGRQKVVAKPLNEIQNIQKVLLSAKFTSFAKSYFAVGKWTDPKPMDYDLEIIPASDLSNVHAGEVVPFRILFMGTPLSSEADNYEYLTATSNTFGGPDNFFLSAYILDGEAQFRLPTAGQWVVNVYIIRNVTPEYDFNELVGKCETVYYSSTVSFTVKP